MTYTGQWLTDIVTKAFFYKKNCMGSPWLDWHCDQGIFYKYLWHIQVNDWLTLWPKLFFKKKLYGKPLTWLTLWPRYIYIWHIHIYDIYRSMTDWHCDQIFFFIKKIVWEALDLTDIVTKVYLINIYDIYRSMTDWHCDQSFF